MVISPRLGRSGEMLDGALLGMAAVQCARLGDGQALTLRLGVGGDAGDGMGQLAVLMNFSWGKYGYGYGYGDTMFFFPIRP